MADLVTLQQYKDFVGLQGVQNDAKINVIIDNVSQLVKTYCGTTIIDYASNNKVEYFNIKDTMVDTIITEESPIIQVVSVQERTSQADAYVTLITENSDSSGKYEYVVDEDSDSIIRTNSTGNKHWAKGMKSVKVTYKAGYTSTPDDLKLAVFDLIKYYLKDERKDRMSIAGATVENATSTSLRNNIGFPDHIKRILDLYKLYS
jgi:hypothetical protein|tara:strand:- start:3731 stop:4342 length:612 start_codon:yes stop_codon:yes gene_type:complete